MLQVGLSFSSCPEGTAIDFPSDKSGKQNRCNSVLVNSEEGDMEAPQGTISSPPISVVITSEAETWDIDASSCMGSGQFVDWDKLPELDQETNSHREILSKTTRELKKLAREGYWTTSHSLRAQAYHQIIQHIPCRLVTPDALVYQDVAIRLFGKQNVSSHPLPEFLEGCFMPTYCLTREGITAVKKILICIGNLFPDITYCPILPAIVTLLLHYSEDEAQCFDNVSHLIACNDSHISYIDQSFLAHKASCMTFGDLANKHCPTAHRLIASASENVSEVYSEWLTWLFGELPFDYAIRILDVYLLEGQKVLYRIALALLRQYKLLVTSRELEVTDIKGDLQAFMQNIREHMTVDKLLERAFGIRLFSRKEIWLLQMANRKALLEKGITMVQRRYKSDPTPVHLLACPCLYYIWNSPIYAGHKHRKSIITNPTVPSSFCALLSVSTVPKVETNLEGEADPQTNSWDGSASQPRNTRQSALVLAKRQSFHLAVDMLKFSSTIVTAQEMRIIWSWIPERFSLFPPVLLFSTLDDGYSLQRFYSCCEGYEPTVLLLKTTREEVCGAFLSSDWNERKRSGGTSSFFGTGECFVFSVCPEMERYEWVFIKKPELTKAVPRSPRQRSSSLSSPTDISSSPNGHMASSSHLSVPVLQRGKVRLSPFLAIRHFLLPSKTASMFMSGTQEGIIIGGGGGQALCIDADLLHGRTEHCETFDNPPLCEENFQVQLLEVWGFQNA
ncbi:PREDICTED: TBC1 domain family member 24-like isoform X2 [Gavialis gangeticus]|uniref:TBC1 domain family member 24-like isoform X2 n=1 Tax=Gavialis gangeticus TaxID=94835 RepID=UPI00092EAFC4|nr:PREDICTED: TBC1 domain family member 24-like isoform X2 [Gavialis gangeticus]